jgi:hydrogenase maturation protease
VSRVLIAGVGNRMLGDDGFGVEVARELGRAPPPNSTVAELGIRSMDLAHELLAPRELLIVADCLVRGGAPGTLYVLQPDDDGTIGGVADIHSMNLPGVFTAVRELGGRVPRTLVVACEPDVIEAGVGLSPAVARAVPAAIDLIRDLIVAEA